MSTRSRRAEASAVSQTGQELHNTSESDSPSLVGVAPEDVEHIVAKAVAAAISVLRDEFDSRLKSVEKRLATIERKFDQMNDVYKWCATNDNVQLPVDDSTISQGANVAGGLSFASLASDMKQTGVTELPKTKKSVRPPVVGRSTSTKLKSVATVREVNIFVSRLHPSTAANELCECVSEVVGCLSVESINCVKLNSKFADLYCSYHVAVKVNANDFSTAIDILNAPDSWPSGTLVRRYFKPRNG